ncbi:MAG: acyl-CoA dehydrogenase family protein [Actinomycetota bacterium]|nr:acyl-CoA dehydrogenase family protein [Actinomycetota bacterium]
MDFELSQEQKAFFEEVKEFAENEIAPNTEEYDRKSEFYWDGWRKMGEIGLLGLPFPEEYGGSDGGALDTAVAMDAFAVGGADAGIALSWGAHTIIGAVPIWVMGTEEQKKKYLPGICSGKKISSFGLTEPDAGSDAASIKTTADRNGDDYVINGSKMFITNGPICDLCIVVAVTDKEKGANGISTFIVDRETEGFEVSRELDKMGNRTSPTAELAFNDCRVPAENLLGAEGDGFYGVGKATLEWERAIMVAPAVGNMEANINRCIEYARERKQFGRPIGKFQSIAFKIADMKCLLDTSRLLVYRVAWMKDQGIPAMMEACVCKLFVTESGFKVANEAVQIFGGYGYIREYPVERTLRDAKLGTIGAGTSEVQKMIISRLLMGKI